MLFCCESLMHTQLYQALLWLVRECMLRYEYSQRLLSCSQWWRWHTAEEVSQSSGCSPCGVITKVRVHTYVTHTHTHSDSHRHTGMLPRPLLRAGLASLCDRHSGIMGGPGQAVAGVWEAHTVHPPTTSTWSLTYSGAAGLKQHLPERHLAAPRSGARLLLHLLNVSWEDPAGKRGPDLNETQDRGGERTKPWLTDTERSTQMSYMI